MENGRVVVAGEDIGASGLMEYVNDLIYITVLIQFGCAFSHWALLGFLIVPGFAIYMFATMGKGDAPQGEDSSAADARQAELAGMSRKERRKFERDERKGR